MPNSMKLRGYTFSWNGSHVTVEGPYPSTAHMLAERWYALTKSPEGLGLFGRADTEKVVTRALGVPKTTTSKPHGPKPATENQIDFATEIGYAVSEAISSDEIGILLDDFKICRFYLHYVWERMTGVKLKDSKAGTDRTSATVKTMVRDPALVLAIRALDANRPYGSKHWPHSPHAFKKVRKMARVDLAQYIPSRLSWSMVSFIQDLLSRH